MTDHPAPIQTAVIGYGLSATVFHLPFLEENPAFKLRTILVRSPAASQEAAKAHPPPVTIVESLDEILGNPEISLVVISTPPETHFPFAKALIQAGKHLVIEKPLCSTSQEAQEIERLSREHGVVVAVYQNRRFDSDFLTLRDTLNSGSLGTIVEYEANFDRFRSQLKDGGLSWKENGETPGSGLSPSVASLCP